MAVVITASNNSTYEAGSLTITGLPTVTAQTIFPTPIVLTLPNGVTIPIQPLHTCRERAGYYIAVNVTSDNAFKLDYQYTTDGGTSWYVGTQVASAAVTVDGGVAGYVNNATLNIPVGYQFRVQVYNSSVSTAAYAYEWRYYSDAG